MQGNYRSTNVATDIHFSLFFCRKKSSSAMQQTTMVNEDMEKGEENEGYENAEGGALTLF